MKYVIDTELEPIAVVVHSKDQSHYVSFEPHEEEIISADENEPEPDPVVEPDPIIEVQPDPEPEPTPVTEPELPFEVNKPVLPNSTISRGHREGLIYDPGVYTLNGDVGNLVLAIDDVTIDFNGHSAASVIIASGVGNVAIKNGRADHVVCEFNYRDNLGNVNQVYDRVGSHDLFFEDMVIHSDTQSALSLRGQRVHMLRCNLFSRDKYAVWGGGISNQEDFLFEQCEFRSGGPQAVFRIHDAYRSLAYNCLFRSGDLGDAKHAFRYHCSDRNSRHFETGDLQWPNRPEELPAHDLAMVKCTVTGSGNGIMLAKTSSERGIEDVHLIESTFEASGVDRFNLNVPMMRRVTVTGNNVETHGGGDPYGPYRNLPQDWTWERNTWT